MITNPMERGGTGRMERPMERIANPMERRTGTNRRDKKRRGGGLCAVRCVRENN